jgi:hypothetical protein
VRAFIILGRAAFSCVFHVNKSSKEASLAHLPREVDVQLATQVQVPILANLGSYFQKNQNRYKGFSYRISFQKKSMKENISYNGLFLRVISSTLNACKKVGIKNK